MSPAELAHVILATALRLTHRHFAPPLVPVAHNDNTEPRTAEAPRPD